MPLFGKSSKSPVELVRVLKESLLVLEKGGDGKKQANIINIVTYRHRQTKLQNRVQLGSFEKEGSVQQ